ncbi:MAG: ChbG/HpnK family deacetylase [Verrucomicrobia bacterium]|nr:MAG: ChbG/HpnK family deacetylase [Verrucomicrobiota bacterium]
MGNKAPIRLIVNGDDFGMSHANNRAIIRAHREGILTSASLMVNENAADHAVRMARENPKLGVGLHITLVCGKSSLKPSETIGLVDQRFEFDRSPTLTGLRYYFSRQVHSSLRQEVDAQFREFRLTKLPMDHVNGHLNFHLHPTIFRMLKRHASDWGIRAMRLTRDPLGLNLKLSFGRYFYRLSHAFIFAWLSRQAGPSLVRRRIRHADHVFGLLQNGRITEEYLVRLLERIGPGNYELYAHPDEDKHAHETEALCSPRVKEMVRQRGIELIRYSDLRAP